MEGLAVIASVGGQTLLLASSQGNSSFHFYVVNRTTAPHLGTFFVDGVGLPLACTMRRCRWGRSSRWDCWWFRTARRPSPDTSPINGYELDGATQFVYVSFLDALSTLRP